MQRVAQGSEPRALTPSTIAQTFSTSRSFGERQAAPMQKRLAPPALAARGSARNGPGAISFSAAAPGVEAHRLRAAPPVVVARGVRPIGAVLGTAAGLDR